MDYQEALNRWGRKEAAAAGKWPDETRDVSLEFVVDPGYRYSSYTFDEGGTRVELMVPIEPDNWWSHTWELSESGPSFGEIIKGLVEQANPS